jgi:hypothetical protein
MSLADFSPLANHLWQSTLFVALVAVLALSLRRNQAHVRHWLWLAASVKFLVPFAFVAFVATLLWMILQARVPQLKAVTGWTMVGLFVVAGLFFLRTTKRNIGAVGDRVDLSNW